MGDSAQRTAGVAARSAQAMTEDDSERARFSIMVMPSAHGQIKQVSAWWCQNRPAAHCLFDAEIDRALLCTRSVWARKGAR